MKGIRAGCKELLGEPAGFQDPWGWMRARSCVRAESAPQCSLLRSYARERKWLRDDMQVLQASSCTDAVSWPGLCPGLDSKQNDSLIDHGIDTRLKINRTVIKPYSNTRDGGRRNPVTVARPLGSRAEYLPHPPLGRHWALPTAVPNY